MSLELAQAYFVEPLSERHDRSRFRCGVAALDHYFQTQAGQDARRRVASPYVLIHRVGSDIAGYYAWSNAGFDLTELPEAVARKLPRYHQIPATLLGRLAVDLNHRGRGLGEFLLGDALRRALRGSESTAAFAVIVEAKDESAVRFYRKFGFVPVIGQTHRLFLPMKTIEQSFS
ncbi:MAG: GNAT family N-acetyltransferase [Verrucomicrobia bacterium]|nr:GNAT family N-acetyltransferase [Verrucomicrobiota bacterium]